MIDDFVKRLEPFYAAAQAKNGAGRPAMNARASDVAEALLASATRRAAAPATPASRKTYEKLPPTGKKHVEAAVPRIGRLVASTPRPRRHGTTAAPPTA